MFRSGFGGHRGLATPSDTSVRRKRPPRGAVGFSGAGLGGLRVRLDRQRCDRGHADICFRVAGSGEIAGKAINVSLPGHSAHGVKRFSAFTRSFGICSVVLLAGKEQIDVRVPDRGRCGVPGRGGFRSHQSDWGRAKTVTAALDDERDQASA